MRVYRLNFIDAGDGAKLAEVSEEVRLCATDALYLV
jgi:hypothetical protein